MQKRKLYTSGAKWNSEVRYQARMWNNWVYRIQVEIQLIKQLISGRTWFVTLTYNDDSLSKRKFLAKYHPDVGLEKICRKDLSRYLDLMRKYFPYRYISTVEYGKKDGRIHHHLLIHCHWNVTLRDLPCWHYGFSKAKLVDDSSKAATYIAKYLTKQEGRIKCSSQYGLTIMRYLRSKPHLELLQLLTPQNYLKLLRRFSRTSRTPTMSLIRRPTSSLPQLIQPYETILASQLPMMSMNLPTIQPPGLNRIS